MRLTRGDLPELSRVALALAGVLGRLPEGSRLVGRVRGLVCRVSKSALFLSCVDQYVPRPVMLKSCFCLARFPCKFGYPG